MELGKVPPHDIEAEQAVIGSMLTDKEAVASAIETLKEEDFYREDNRLIYVAILNLYSRSEPIDIITVKAELESMGKFEQVGGLEYLADLPEKVPTTANVSKYIKIVEEKSTLRNLIRTANEIIDLGYDGTENVEDIMEGAEKKIFNVIQNKNQKGYTPIKDVLVESFTQLEELYNRKQHITGVPSGFTELDNKTAGFHGSELILIAARPAMGKSAFVLNIATNAALKAKNDEFYTLLTDIEKEMRYYRKHFKGKTVLCNCDDPFESNFFKYFVHTFGGFFEVCRHFFRKHFRHIKRVYKIAVITCR